MSERAAWFRCDPSRLLGALAGMEPDSGYVYTVILMRIYEVGGPIPDDEAVLSRRTGLSPKRVANSLSWLVKHGKIKSLSCGSIDSETTHAELAFREKSVIDARNAGKESAKRKQKFHAEKSQQKQQTTSTPVERPFNERTTTEQRPSTEIDIEKDIEEGTNVPSNSEASASVVRTKKKQEVFRYPPDFERFWSAYPTDANMSKRKASDQWERLSVDEREKAILSCVPFRSYCATRPDYRPVHAERYLSEGRFEGHAAGAAKAAETAGVFVRIDTPQWLAWAAHYRRTKGHSPPVDKQGKGWRFPSEYPPKLSVVATGQTEIAEMRG